MTHVIVDPGVCGLTADITVETADFGQVSIALESQCKMVRALVESLEQPVDAFSVLGMAGGPPILEAARADAGLHAACPVVAGIVKAVEVASSMALPKDAAIRFVD